MTTAAVTLTAGRLSLEVLPALGGGVASFAQAGADGTRHPIFRPRQGTGGGEDMGLYVLAPWSNRVGGGGFTFEGRRHALPPTVQGEALPLHGDAWQRPWTVRRQTGREVSLQREGAVGPYRYEANLDYALDERGLSCRLTLVSRAACALPFGAGFHPWFPRCPATRLTAAVASVWLQDGRYLPTEQLAIARRPEWDWSVARALPKGWINACFGGWDGRARLQLDRDLALQVTTDPPLDHCIVYAPGGDAPFFCFEPVTHAIDAFNLPPGPLQHGLHRLEPGQALSIGCRFEPDDT